MRTREIKTVNSKKEYKKMKKAENGTRKLNRAIAVIMAVLLAAACCSCGAQTSAITVISREDGSGTRGAFVELMGIVDENDNDITTDSALIENSTSVVMTSVAGDANAIGYVSLGSLSDTVKALKIDGVIPSVEDIKNGRYKVSRPFNIVTKGTPNELAEDFISFIMSSQGQSVVEEEGYISAIEGTEYKATGKSGKLSVAGSTSVGPVMEALVDKYRELNSGANVEIQQTGSSAGIESTVKGVCDIGMASRELKDSEMQQGVTASPIALDGIAVIVNKENKIEDISSEQVKKIYTGELTDWSELE